MVYSIHTWYYSSLYHFVALLFSILIKKNHTLFFNFYLLYFFVIKLLSLLLVCQRFWMPMSLKHWHEPKVDFFFCTPWQFDIKEDAQVSMHISNNNFWRFQRMLLLLVVSFAPFFVLGYWHSGIHANCYNKTELLIVSVYRILCRSSFAKWFSKNFLTLSFGFSCFKEIEMLNLL